LDDGNGSSPRSVENESDNAFMPIEIGVLKSSLEDIAGGLDDYLKIPGED